MFNGIGSLSLLVWLVFQHLPFQRTKHISLIMRIFIKSKMNTKEKPVSENLKTLREAWKNMPTGAKSRLYTVFGYTAQNISDVLKNGRKDESYLLSIINAIKQASKDVAEDVNERNEIVQSL